MMSRWIKRALAATGLAAFLAAVGVGTWLNRAEAAESKTVAAGDVIACPIDGKPIAADDCPAPRCPLCE